MHCLGHWEQRGEQDGCCPCPRGAYILLVQQIPNSKCCDGYRRLWWRIPGLILHTKWWRLSWDLKYKEGVRPSAEKRRGTEMRKNLRCSRNREEARVSRFQWKGGHMSWREIEKLGVGLIIHAFEDLKTFESAVGSRWMVSSRRLMCSGL